MTKFKHDIRIQQKGYGHWRVTTTYYGKEINCTTTDSTAIDDWNSDEYEKCGRELRKLRGYRKLRYYCIRANKNYY